MDGTDDVSPVAGTDGATFFFFLPPTYLIQHCLQPFVKDGTAL
jgi:hypothetical protein